MYSFEKRDGAMQERFMRSPLWLIRESALVMPLYVRWDDISVAGEPHACDAFENVPP